MKNLIEPSKAEIAEYYCDACKQLVFIDGLDKNAYPETHKEFSVALQANFGNNSNTPGLVFTLDLCNDCGEKLIKATEELFKIKLESNLFEDLREG